MLKYILSLSFLFLFTTDALAANQCSKIFYETSQNDTAVNVVRSLEVLQNKFFQKMSQHSIDDLIKKIKTDRNSKELARSLKALNQNEVHFTMIAPSNARLGIKNEGFKNLHQTKHTRGFDNYEARKSVEASFSNMSKKQFESLPDAVKPKYGLLRTALNSEITSDVPDQYGDDVYTFKKELLENRVTFTIGDSLNSYAYVQEAIEDYNLQLSTVNWLEGQIGKPESWDLAFIPYKYKELIALYATVIKEAYSNTDRWKVKAEGTAHDNYTGHQHNSVAASYDVERVANSPDYIELQFWGEVNIDHVDTFTFRRVPPSGDFLKALKDRNVKIYDARNENYNLDQSKVKIWDEDAESGQQYQTDSARKASGSTGGRWIKDKQGNSWFIKKDVLHPELQTSAEVISSLVYSYFGFNTPETRKEVIRGEFYSFSKDIGNGTMASDLSEFNNSEFRQMRIIAAYLMDWDRIGNPANNRVRPDGSVVLLDFGGTLGARAQGEFKPGKVFSPAIGSFNDGGNTIYASFAPQISADHPWNKINKTDIKNALQKLKALDDGTIVRIVKAAKYTNRDDFRYMYETLVARRDNLIAELKALVK